VSLTTRQLLQHASNSLNKAGCDSPRLDAELLLMRAWSVSRTDLIIRATEFVPEAIKLTFDKLVQRRREREPLAYILGEKEFWSRLFQVDADVLIPRPETEHLIEAVLAHFPDQQAKLIFYDIGTGSGCIAITLACEYPNARIIATDISDAALSVASSNAIMHQVDQRIRFLQGDMLSALQNHHDNDTDRCDAIISNPPYVSQDEMAELEQELSHEPRHALTDEGDGLRHLNVILDDGPAYLQANGLIILETGPCGLPATPASLQLEHHIRDLAGHARGAIYKSINDQIIKQMIKPTERLKKHG